MNTRLCAIGLLLAAAAVARAEMRTWTFEKSGKTMQGEIVGFSGKSVTLRGPDGKTFSTRISFFTESDQTYLIAERAKQWKDVEVVKLSGTEAGVYKKCSVHGPGVGGEIYVHRLPQAVEAVLNSRNQQAAPIEELSQQIDDQSRALHDAKAGSGHRSRGRGRAKGAQTKLAAAELKEAEANLAKLQKAYDDYVEKTKPQTMVKMRNTGLLYKKLPVWECLDPRKPQG